MQLGRRLRTHYLYQTVMTIIATGVLYLMSNHHEAIPFLTDATGYISFVLLAVILILGPYNLITKKKNPVSTYLRRDIGIFAGILAVIHSVIGLFVHLRGRMVLYFLAEKGDHLIFLLDRFRIANYLGVLATLVIIALLAISNDYSIQKLKVTRWKNLQRLSYIMIGLALSHAILYSNPAENLSRLLYLYLPLTIITLIFQGIGIVLKRAENS